MSTIFIVLGVVSFIILLVFILTGKSDETDAQNNTCCFPSSSLLEHQKMLEVKMKDEYKIRRFENEIINKRMEIEKERIKHLTDRQLLEEIHTNIVLANIEVNNDSN